MFWQHCIHVQCTKLQFKCLVILKPKARLQHLRAMDVHQSLSVFLFQVLLVLLFNKGYIKYIIIICSFIEA